MASVKKDLSAPAFNLPFAGVLVLAIFLFHSRCYADDTVISADSIEYDGKTFVYKAEGSVRVQNGDALIEAETVYYNDRTSSVSVFTGVSYDNPDVSIKADRAQLNLDSKTGRLYNAYIFVKKDNFHVRGAEVEKRGENEYFLSGASFTTCNAPFPEWCLRGKDVDLALGNKIKAKGVTFNVKGFPVLYTPYISAALRTERKTGVLIPSIGYSDLTGISIRQPFFLAISENRDSTLTLDFYSKRGIGESVEYRYMEKSGIKGNLYLYHIRDTEVDKDLYKINAVHDQKNAFLEVNLVNFRDFFHIYEPYLEKRALRFLDSRGEASMRFDDSRLYFTGRYLYDLKGGDTAQAMQRLPEAGFVNDPVNIGPAVLSLSTSISNFIAEEGPGGQRLDISPVLSHSAGRVLNLFQSVGLGGTIYFLKGSEDIKRETLRYEVSGRTALMKNYKSFSHVIEPALTYRYINQSGGEPPLFDSMELPLSSSFEASLMNRLIDERGEFITFRMSQTLDSDNRGILRADVNIRRPFALRADMSYDTGKGALEGLNSEVNLRIKDISFSAGERYMRGSALPSGPSGSIQTGIMLYTLGFGYFPSKALSLEGRLWYDEKKEELRDITASLRYKSQCWGMTVLFTKRPDDKSIFITIDLLGLGTYKYGT